MERRLAAILASDVVGYSRLIRADEEGTLAALKGLRADLIDPTLAEHNGRIVKLMGDGMLAEFASVVDAVRAAVETQRAVAERNADIPEEKRIEFRVGIYLGDVVIDGDDIQGDGVNVAARLEALAEPGGICVSGMVYEGVRDRIDIPFEDMGEQEVKNIARPIRMWRWSEAASAGSTMTGGKPLPLPDKPSIAVLPFDNMSGDPDQEYLADGITEDLITALARCRWLRVIARNSTFAYKGRSTDIRRISEELGVRYVLEGSVRRSGGRIRVTAQLIDGRDGSHLWGQRYDRDVDDIFALQDEIAAVIAGPIEPELEMPEVAAIRGRPTVDLSAWDCYLRGLWHLYRFTTEELETAKTLFERAIALDPSLAQTHFALGQALCYLERHDEAIREIDEALRLSPRDPHLWAFLNVRAMAHYIANDLAQTEADERAALRQPNATFWPYLILVAILGRQGKRAEALDAMAELRRLRPGFLHADAISELYFGDHPFMTQRFIDQFAADVRNAGLLE